MSIWRESTLGELLSFSNGKTSPERTDGLAHPVYGSNGIIGFSNKTNAPPRILIIGRVGSYCGSLYFSDDICWVTDNAILAKSINGNDSKFLFYLLHTLRLNDRRAGSGQPLLNQSILSSIPVVVPSHPEQRAIAHVLGTLDDKIELNRSMNETLEEMARALFKSWFINFDPVRAKMEGRNTGLPKHIADFFPDRMMDSELGEIPEGWEVSKLYEMIDLNPKRLLQNGKLAPYLDMANMPTKNHVPDVVRERAFGSGMRFANGDTLVARITPCLENGKTAYIDFLKDGEVGWGSTEYIVMKPIPPLPDEFAYYLARSTRFREFAIQNMTGTSGRQRVPAKALSDFLFPLPPNSIAIKFGRIARSILSRVSEATQESNTLATLRDTLLPKLMSGEVKVRYEEHPHNA